MNAALAQLLLGHFKEFLRNNPLPISIGDSDGVRTRDLLRDRQTL